MTDVSAKLDATVDVELLRRALRTELNQDDPLISQYLKSFVPRRLWKLVDNEPAKLTLKVTEAFADSYSDIAHRVTISGNEIHYQFNVNALRRIEERQRSGLGHSILWRWAVYHFALTYIAKHAELDDVAFDLDYGDRPTKATPVVSFSSNRQEDFLTPDPFFVQTGAYERDVAGFQDPLPWTARELRLFWRGSASGIGPFYERPRVKLAAYCAARAARWPMLDVGLSKVTNVDLEVLDQDALRTLREQGILRDPVPFAQFANYKFLFDIDGNSNSWGGMFRKLLTGSAIIKVASANNYRQWYYDRLTPGKLLLEVPFDLGGLEPLLELIEENRVAGAELAAGARQLAREMDLPGELNRTGLLLKAWLKAHPPAAL